MRNGYVDGDDGGNDRYITVHVDSSRAPENILEAQGAHDSRRFGGRSPSCPLLQPLFVVGDVAIAIAIATVSITDVAVGRSVSASTTNAHESDKQRHYEALADASAVHPRHLSKNDDRF